MASDFTKLIKDKCGINFYGRDQGVLINAVGSRMKDCDLSEMDSYFDLVSHDDNELHHLVDYLTTNETYFMREPAHIDFAVNFAFPEIEKRIVSGLKVKILSAGCSTGEESYSIAIALVEKYGFEVLDRVEIVGIDIDSNVLKKARAGIYGKHSFRMFADCLRDKYFTASKDRTFTISKELLDVTSFFHVNLMSESSLSEFSGSDIIFYRNVSIYFDEETQQKIFNNLAGALSPGGYLFLSSTETMAHDFGSLPLERTRDLFYFKKPLKDSAAGKASFEDVNNVVKTKDEVKTSVVAPVLNISDSGDVVEKNENSFKDALLLARAKKYNESLDVIDELLETSPDDEELLTLKASVLISLNEIDLAVECIEILKEIDKFSFDASLLEGIAKKSNNELEMAEKKFKDALYIDSSSWLAHFYLAELYYSMGNKELALREYSVIKSIIEKYSGKTLTAHHFLMSFTSNELLHHCDSIINNINKKTY